MTLGTKFNLILVSVFLIGFGAVGVVVRGQLAEHAREASLETAGLMMDSALSVRTYTTDQIRPLLNQDLQKVLHPQTVPAYAATEMFEALRKNNSAITYKEATLNPSNPRDKATDWEADIVNSFRNHPETPQLSGDRVSATGPTLYVARPIKVSSEACLLCHGEPKLLPASVKEKYGDQQGLGWKLNEVVGAQIASVPTSEVQERANKQFSTFLGLLLVVFLGLIVALNLLLNRVVIAPIKKIAAAADAVSSGDVNGPELPTQGADEISTLAASFNRMTRSLRKALEIIDHE